MPAMSSGRVSTSRSLLPLRSLRVIAEPLAAELGVGQLEALDHRAHRAVEDEDALGEQLVEGVAVSVVMSLSMSDVRAGAAVLGRRGFDAAGDEHGKGIAGAARADAHLDVGEARDRSAARASCVVREAELAIAELFAHPGSSCARRSRTSTLPPGRTTRAASASASAGIGRVMQRLRQQGDVDRCRLERQLFELAALERDVRRRGGGRPAPWRARARPASDRRR